MEEQISQAEFDRRGYKNVGQYTDALLSPEAPLIHGSDLLTKGDVLHVPGDFLGYNPHGTGRAYLFPDGCGDFNGKSWCDPDVFQIKTLPEWNARISSMGIRFNPSVGSEAWNWLGLDTSSVTKTG
jgi:hypothetical protein